MPAIANQRDQVSSLYSCRIVCDGMSAGRAIGPTVFRNDASEKPELSPKKT